MYVIRVKNETWNCSAAAAADDGPSRNILYVYYMNADSIVFGSDPVIVLFVSHTLQSNKIHLTCMGPKYMFKF